MALFDQSDEQSPLREKESCRCTNDAAPDHDDIRLGRELLIVLYAFDNWRHWIDLNLSWRLIYTALFLPLRQKHLRQ
ncbi:hypothetical protein GCM10010520_55560 [Rhizobium viscosum]